MNRALFLDRDGVINIDYGYVHTRDSFHFLDGIFDLVRTARERDYKVIVVTNQAGIGRGYYSKECFLHLNKWMCEEFSKVGAPIDKVYFSPYHPTAGIGEYLKDDFSRKPHPGMLLQAKKELAIDLERSILVGDRISDIQAGVTAGISKNLLLLGNSREKFVHPQCTILKNLYDAIPYLLSGVE